MGWNLEPYVVLEQVGDTGLCVRCNQRKWAMKRRNSLKLCSAPVTEPQSSHLSQIWKQGLEQTPHFTAFDLPLLYINQMQ